MAFESMCAKATINVPYKHSSISTCCCQQATGGINCHRYNRSIVCLFPNTEHPKHSKTFSSLSPESSEKLSLLDFLNIDVPIISSQTPIRTCLIEILCKPTNARPRTDSPYYEHSSTAMNITVQFEHA